MITSAIGGPSGAGKSTLARRLSAQLHYLYVDTGAMYRTIGLYGIKQGVDLKNEAAVCALLPQIKLDLRYVEGAQHMFLNDVDVSGEIRTEQVSMAASTVSAYAAVRAFLLETQRNFAKTSNILMDGRDIGTVVLPQANAKIFLTATPEERARRRHAELVQKGEEASYETVLADVKQRDYNDTHRAIAPLKAAPDAITVDTTEVDFEGAFALLLSTIEKKLQADGTQR